MYVYGKNVAKEILDANEKIEVAYIMDNFNDQLILSELQKKKIKIEILPKNDFLKLAGKNHQGIMLKVPEYEYCDVDELLLEDDNLLVILDHLEDPHNFGAIIRTCEAAGVNGIIIPKDRSVSVNSTVMKVSTGALKNMKVSRVINLKRTIDYLKKQGFWIVGTDMDGEMYDTIDYSGNIAIVIGNEGKGMSRLVKESCDFIASIPMNGKVNSLNASVASAIVIYEAIKKRR